ncbi:hypothetical protein [Ammonifex degensii]|uniref:hypothetical protein n=1 Tax=Ammonifex degensii TaxID=42838 RepID=UPI0003174F12|nr:hypothetical protein [Ammonifex degensii]
MYGFVGASPGAGATTLACASALHLAGAGEVVLVDLSPHGKVRVYMGLLPDTCPGSVLDAEGLSDPAGIRVVAVDSGRGPQVIPAPWRGLDCARVTASLVLKALLGCRKAFPLTVAVLPPLWGAGWPGALLSDTLFVVTKPDREDLDRLGDVLSLAARLGAGARTRVVANQVGLPGGIATPDFLEAVRPHASVPYARAVREQCNRRFLNPSGKLFGELFSLLE